MNNTQRLEVYRAQCENVRYLVKTFKQTKRCINQSLRKNRPHEAQAHIRILALIFCSWSEASFSKTIHTPHGFTLDEISKIKHSANHNGISQGWNKCIELAMEKTAFRRSQAGPNARKALKRLVKELVLEPSKLRNKIAHGQWVEPLNKYATSVNNDLKQNLESLDSVTVDTWYERQSILCQIIETLIESPTKSFTATYWGMVQEIDDIKSMRSNWNDTSKMALLRKECEGRTTPLPRHAIPQAL